MYFFLKLTSFVIKSLITDVRRVLYSKQSENETEVGVAKKDESKTYENKRPLEDQNRYEDIVM